VNAGSGINAFNFAKFLKDEGFCVTLMTFNRNLKLKSRENLEGVPFFRIPYFNKNIVLKLLSLIFIIPNYILCILKHNIILIYGGHIIGYELIILFSKLFGKKVIFQSLLLKEDDLDTILRRRPIFIRSLYLYIFKIIDIYFSINSEFTRRYLSHIDLTQKIFESPQGLNTGIFFPVNQEKRNKLRGKLKLPKDKFVIITCGFLVNRKGFEEIFRRLEKINIPFLYVIVGDYKVSNGHFLSKFQDEMDTIHKSGLTSLKNKILFTGPKTNIHQYYQCADVFLLNSVREGLPNVLLEAMASGIVPVVRNLPGVTNFITFHNENALVFENGDQMEVYLLELFNNVEKREYLSKNAEKTIVQNASFNIVTEKLFTKLAE